MIGPVKKRRALTAYPTRLTREVSAKIHLPSRNRVKVGRKGVQRHGLGGPKSSAALPWAFQAVAEEVAPNGDGDEGRRNRSSPTPVRPGSLRAAHGKKPGVPYQAFFMEFKRVFSSIELESARKGRVS